MLSQRNWNFVVLQDQSAVPGGADEKKFADALTALRSFFAPRLPKAESGVVVLYSSWVCFSNGVVHAMVQLSVFRKRSRAVAGLSCWRLMLGLHCRDTKPARQCSRLPTVVMYLCVCVCVVCVCVSLSRSRARALSFCVCVCVCV